MPQLAGNMSQISGLYSFRKYLFPYNAWLKEGMYYGGDIYGWKNNQTYLHRFDVYVDNRQGDGICANIGNTNDRSDCFVYD